MNAKNYYRMYKFIHKLRFEVICLSSAKSSKLRELITKIEYWFDAYQDVPSYQSYFYSKIQSYLLWVVTVTPENVPKHFVTLPESGFNSITQALSSLWNPSLDLHAP